MALESVKISELGDIGNLDPNDFYLITRGSSGSYQSYRQPYRNLSSSMYDSVYSQISDQLTINISEDTVISIFQDHISGSLDRILQESSSARLSGNVPSIGAVRNIFKGHSGNLTVDNGYIFRGNLQRTGSASSDDDVVTVKDISNLDQLRELVKDVVQEQGGVLTLNADTLSTIYITNKNDQLDSSIKKVRTDQSSPVIFDFSAGSDPDEGGGSRYESVTFRLDIYNKGTDYEIGVYGYAGPNGDYFVDDYDRAKADIANSVAGKRWSHFVLFGADNPKSSVFSKNFTVRKPMWICVFPKIKIDKISESSKIDYLKMNQKTKTAYQACSGYMASYVYEYSGTKELPSSDHPSQDSGKGFLQVRLKNKIGISQAFDPSYAPPSGKTGVFCDSGTGATINDDGSVTVTLGGTSRTISKDKIYQIKYYVASVGKRSGGYIVPEPSARFSEGSQIIVNVFN